MKKHMKSLKKIFPKRFFSVVLISYACLLSIQFFLAAYLSHTLNTQTLQRYKESVMANLEQSAALFDQQLQEMDWNAQKLVNQPRLLTIMQYDELKPGDTRVVTLASFQEYLSDLFSEQFSSYVVALKNDYVFTKTGMVTGTRFFFENLRVYSETDYDTWFSQSFCAPGPVLLPYQKIVLSDSVQNAITYSCPIGDYYTGNGSNACIQFLIPDTFLRNIFRPIEELEGCELTLYHLSNGSFTPLVHINAEGMDSGQSAFLPQEISTTEASSGYLHSGSGQKSSEWIWVLSPENHILATAQLPYQLILSETHQARQNITFIIAFCMILEIALGLFFSYRYSAPLQSLLHQLMPNTTEGKEILCKSDSPPVSEYAQLKEGVAQIIRKSSQLENQLSKKAADEIHNFYRMVINGAHSTEKELQQRLQDLKLSTTGNLYCVCVCEFPKNTVDPSLRKTTEDILLSETLVQWYGFEQESRLILILSTNTDISGQSSILPFVYRLQKILSSQVCDNIHIGLGREYLNLQDIHLSYEQAVYCTDLACARKSNSPILYNEAAENLHLPYYPNALEERLTNAVRRGDSTQIQEIFALLKAENLEKRKLPGVMQRLLRSNILSTLLNVDSDLTLKSKAPTSSCGQYEALPLDQALTAMEQDFLQLSYWLKEDSGRKNDFAEKFMNMIETHYMDQQLSVKSASEYFGYSESYFSTLFKEYVGEAFGTSLEQVRLSHAKELLIQGLCVEDVAAQVGYSNSGSFRRAFKRVIGSSPKEYRLSAARNNKDAFPVS